MFSSISSALLWRGLLAIAIGVVSEPGRASPSAHS
jgi:hypothetical protein